MAGLDIIPDLIRESLPSVRDSIRTIFQDYEPDSELGLHTARELWEHRNQNQQKENGQSIRENALPGLASVQSQTGAYPNNSQLQSLQAISHPTPPRPENILLYMNA